MIDLAGCPDEIELCGLAQGTLSDVRGGVLRDHIADCDACRVAVAGLAEVEARRATGGAGDARGDGDPAVDRPRYELQRLVATGGMGEVFLARDTVLGRDVAIKLLHEDASSPDSLMQSRRRVMREARALASLAHPNVVAVYDQGVLDGRAFLAMEYVRGRTLRQWMVEEKPRADRVVDVLLQAGRGLLAAHEIGIVHRDFKPDNVLVGDDGRARVTDFGLARTVSKAEPPSTPSVGGESDIFVTVDGAISGTPAYMAAEQLAGMSADARSDQYAFCVTLYEAIHGTRPGLDPNPARPTFAKRRDRRSQRIDESLARGLLANPVDRYASMGDLLAEIERAVGSPVRRANKTHVLLLTTTFLGLAIATWLVVDRRAPAASVTPPGLHSPCHGVSGGCPSPLVCRYSEGNFCGASEAPGVCGWPVDGCDAKSSAVCGCNGITYKNSCEAHRAGASTGHRGACVPCTVTAPCADLTAGGNRTAAFCRVEEERTRPAAERSPGGTCWPRPSSCEAGGDPVCAWDGRTYENACEARRSGTDVQHGGPCPEGAFGRRSQPEATIDAFTRPASGGLTFGVPDEQGMDARPLMRLAEWIQREKLPIFSILISKNGVLVYELYTSSLTREHAHYVMGVTGAFTSALMGVAIDRHLVRAPETSVADALPASVFPSDARRERFRGVTIRDVLAMSALDAPVPPHDKSAESKERFRQFWESPNRTKFALTQALLSEPGASFQFNDITPQIATGIIEYATRMSALEFAEQSIFRFMDFRNYEWMHQDRAGIDNGAYGLRLRPIDMQKFGVLYLQQGMWEEKRLLSSEWALRSFTPWIKSPPTLAEPNYGWYWWTIDFGAPATSRQPRHASRGWTAHVAQGWKGQRIAVFADQGIVVTMTAVIEPPEDEAAIFRRIIRDHVVPSIEGTGAAPPPDPKLRRELVDLRERIQREAVPLKHDLDPRMVPSVEPKEHHHGFGPD